MQEINQSVNQPDQQPGREAIDGRSAADLQDDHRRFEEQHQAQLPEEFLAGPKLLKRIVIVLSVLVVLGLLVAVPPLVNVGRYRRRIVTSISASLGRPVHIDSVTLNVLPLPGFTLNNFVVSEDPAFGSEPVIRANTVQATLRISSLWRRRVEFSKISLTDPSVNLVHRADGRWNLESILLQASRMPAAPTAQRQAGEAQRFPYIEATGARLDIKMDGEKMPFSLTDADFALWLPQPEQWHLRLEAHPTRTDTAVSDTGTLRVEGTLGKASTLANVPVEMTAEWKAVPLGSVSLIALGRDAGMRGEMNVTASARGTVGEHVGKVRVHLTGLRRTEFVPVHPLDVDVNCSAAAVGILTTLQDVRCTWPVSSDAPADTAGLLLTGTVPDTRHPESAFGAVTVTNVPGMALLDGLRVASARVPAELTLAGMLGGTVTREQGADAAGELTVKDSKLTWGTKPVFAGDVVARVQGSRLLMDPVAMELGGKDLALVGASVDAPGYEVDVRGGVAAGVLKGAGWGSLSSPVDVKATRAWGTDAAWSFGTPVKTKAPTHKHHH
jgi:AsmA protein